MVYHHLLSFERDSGSVGAVSPRRLPRTGGYIRLKREMNEETKLSKLAENVRFFADMHFKQLTLFMAAMTAVTGGIVVSSLYQWWIALGGLCITAVIWTMEIRSTINVVTNYSWLRCCGLGKNLNCLHG
jgi:hypothetical protein